MHRNFQHQVGVSQYYYEEVPPSFMLRNITTTTTTTTSDISLPPCTSIGKADWIECHEDNNDWSMDVVLTVYKRDNLKEQLGMIAAQTLLPSQIIVVQNEDHHFPPNYISSIIEEWNNQNHSNTTTSLNSTTNSYISRPPCHLVQFSKDSQYHGRFHIAYLSSKAKFVSLWDDDLTVGSSWLEVVVNFLRTTPHVIASTSGRVLRELPAGHNDWTAVYGLLSEFRSPIEARTTDDDIIATARRVDFTVQHHTLERRLLRHYVGFEAFTYATGEDIQLSFALQLQQQQGIQAYALQGPSNTTSFLAQADQGLGANGAYASWKQKAQEPRQWLLCRLVLAGMKFDDCRNCDIATATTCLAHFQQTGSTMRHRQSSSTKKPTTKQARMNVVDPSQLTLREQVQYYRNLKTN